MEGTKKLLEKHLIMLSEQAEKNADNLDALLRISREMCNIAQTIKNINLYLLATASITPKVSADINIGQFNREKITPYPQYTEPKHINDTGNIPIS